MTELSDRQLATLLAALRAWQAAGCQANTDIMAIATDSGELAPLSAAEIDELCQVLNTSTVVFHS